MQPLITRTGVETSENIHFIMERCCVCFVPFLMPLYMQKELLADRERYFFCPNGHSQHYTGVTKEDELRSLLQKERADHDKHVATLKNEISSLKKSILPVRTPPDSPNYAIDDGIVEGSTVVNNHRNKWNLYTIGRIGTVIAIRYGGQKVKVNWNKEKDGTDMNKNHWHNRNSLKLLKQ